MIRVVIADDHAVMRRAIRLLLSRCTDVETVGEAPDGHEAINCVKLLQPDVLVTDIRMPPAGRFLGHKND